MSQQRISPASNPRLSLDGFSHGIALNIFAILSADGEK